MKTKKFWVYWNRTHIALYFVCLRCTLCIDMRCAVCVVWRIAFEIYQESASGMTPKLLTTTTVKPTNLRPNFCEFSLVWGCLTQCSKTVYFPHTPTLSHHFIRISQDFKCSNFTTAFFFRSAARKTVFFRTSWIPFSSDAGSIGEPPRKCCFSLVDCRRPFGRLLSNFLPPSSTEAQSSTIKEWRYGFWLNIEGEKGKWRSEIRVFSCSICEYADIQLPNNIIA